MSDSTPVNIQAFQPNDGGQGVEFDATTASQEAVRIPGTDGNTSRDKMRVLIVNDGPSSASIRLGSAGVQVNTGCMRVPAGLPVLLTPPSLGPGGIWFNAICKEGAANLQITAGQGT